MSKGTKMKALPWLLIVIGLLLLFVKGIAIPAGVLFLLAYVMIIEQIWPEEWEADKKDKMMKM